MHGMACIQSQQIYSHLYLFNSSMNNYLKWPLANFGTCGAQNSLNWWYLSISINFLESEFSGTLWLSPTFTLHPYRNAFGIDYHVKYTMYISKMASLTR